MTEGYDWWLTDQAYGRRLWNRDWK
jgi:hypothetical protein